MWYRQIITTALAAAMLGAVAFAEKVSYDFDRNADFSQFKTFGFKEGTRSGNALVDDHIEKAIAASLAVRGLTEDESTPDLFVVTHLTLDKQKDITAYSAAPAYGLYGWHWGGGWGTTDVRVRDLLTGTLIIDMADAKKGDLIWRGIGVKEVKSIRKSQGVDSTGMPESVDRNVAEAVTKILKNFPPKAAT
jgi:uncharacterized protein DUF4136